MSIKPHLLVIAAALSLNIGVACHAGDFDAPFDDGDGLSAFQTHKDMSALIAPEPAEMMREGLKTESYAENEVKDIETLKNPKIYMSDQVLKDEVIAVNLAQRAHFDYDKYAMAFTASHAPTTWWGKFLKFIRWDKISSFMIRNEASAEQWEQVYMK